MENLSSLELVFENNFVPWNRCYVIFIQAQVMRTRSYTVTL